MLLVASIIVVAGQWEAIGPEARFAGLVGSLFAVYFAAEATRRRICATATALAVLAACLTAPVGIAAAAALQAAWPICITIGGLASLGATELQARRWTVRSLKAAQVVAVGLSTAGVAALTDVPVSLLGAAAAATALAVGATRRSVAIAALVPLVPLLDLVARAGVGSGTLARLGAVGVAAWVAPLSSLVAGAVIAVTAHRRSSATLAVGAIATVTWGFAVGLVDAAPPVGVWLSLPAATVTLLELLAFTRERSIFGRWADRARDVAAPLLGLLGMALPVLTVLGSVVAEEFGDGSLRSVLLPVCATTVALLVAAIAARLGDQPDSWTVDHLAVSAIGAATAIPVVVGVDLQIVAGLALGGWLLSTALSAWRWWIPVTVLHVSWALPAIAVTQPSPGAFTAIVLTSAGMMLLALSSSTASEARFVGVPLTVASASLLLAAAWVDQLSWLTAALAVVAAVTTGAAMRTEHFDAIDAFALSTGAAALVVAVGATPAAVSLALTLVAAQWWLYAVAYGRTEGAVAAAVVGGGSLASLWWTTGTNQLAIDRLAPYGIDGQDLALAAASIALLAAGVAIRMTVRPSTWLAYGPGLGTSIAWLLISQDAPDGDWATFGALVVGVGAVGIGGARRLGAPLVCGTIALLGTLLVSAGPRLAAAPTWAWIAVGGVGLLVVAAVIERSERPLLRIGSHRDDDSLVASFCREFE